MNDFTAAAAPTQKFRPNFDAVVTPVTIEKGMTKSADPIKFSKITDGSVSYNGKTETCTVMIFGKTNAAVARRLKPGVPLTLAEQYDCGTVRIIGWPREKQTAAA